MKTEFTDVSETEKTLLVEIPSTVVDAEIERVARDYGRAARLPGFRPGKAPLKIVRQRFRERILHDVAHDLIPRAVDEALRERGQEPVNTPDIRDVSLDEGKPLRFTAAFETVPPIDPGDLATLVLRRPSSELDADAVAKALERLRERHARFEPVERPAERGDTVTLDLDRRQISAKGQAVEKSETKTHEDVAVEIGAAANPPGLDDELTGTSVGTGKTFVIRYPADYPASELADTEVEYAIVVKAIKQRVLPALDDEFARDLGEFDSLTALTERVEGDLRRQAQQESDRQMRSDLFKQLAARLAFAEPPSLVEREMERRVEDFARRLLEQQIDPRRMDIDWQQLREQQREPAREAVRSALVLDQIARRESLAVTDGQLAQEIERYAERSGRAAAAVRAELEKEGGIARVRAGLLREQTIDFVLSRARIEAA